MATQRDLIEKAVTGALEQIQKNAPAEYAKLNADPSQKEKVIEAAKAGASETLKLNEEFADEPQNIEERLAKHLPEGRIKLIKEGLNIPTFRLEFAKRENAHFVQFTREGEQFLPEIKLASTVDIKVGKVLQYASIFVEGILLVLSASGISLKPSGKVISEACTEIRGAIESSSELLKTLEDFVKAWHAAGDGVFGYWKKAKALFHLLKGSYSSSKSIYWNVMKLLCSDMSLTDWLHTSARVTAMLVAAFATDGVALIAKLVLSVKSDVDFKIKIANVIQLVELQKSL